MLARILDLLYPRLCFACGAKTIAKDRTICLSCEYKITPTNYHELTDNPVMERFVGRLPIHAATAAFTFSKGGLLQQLIHQLKYKNRPEIGLQLGQLYGLRLKEQAVYNSVDYIIPVPLHPKKEHKRGYNQAAMWGKGLSNSLGVECTERFLKRTTFTTTQTKKSRMERFENVEHAFEVQQQDQLKDKHLLVVDDVLTTGATLEACALKLLAVEGVTVSVACIALAGG